MMDNIDDEINPYHKTIIYNTDKENIIILQMEQSLILSNVVNYMQYDKNPKNFHDLDIRTIDLMNHRKIYERLKEEDRQVLY